MWLGQLLTNRLYLLKYGNEIFPYKNGLRNIPYFMF